MKNHLLAERLVYQRKLKGLTQERLAELTQVTVRTIQRVEKGEVQPHLRTVKLLAAALEVEVDELLPLENPKEETIQTKWLLLMHASPFIGFVIPFLNIILPLFLWIHKREDNSIYNRHGKAVINFQISMTLLFVVAIIALISVQGYGFALFMAVIPFSIIVMLGNIISVIKTQKCYYPLAIPFLGRVNTKASSTLAVLLICTCALSSSFAPKASASQASSMEQQLSQFEQFLKKQKKDKAIPGLAVAISHKQQIVYDQAFGVSNIAGKKPLEKDTPFWIASVSKYFVATAFLSLVDSGELSLDDEINHTPEFEEYCTWLANSGIIFGKNLNCQQMFKLKHALNHVVNGKVDSSFYYNSIFYSRLSRFLEAKRGNPIAAAKGRHNELAKVISENIFEQANMQNSIAGLWDDSRQNVYFRRTRGYGVEDNTYVARPEPKRHMAGGAGLSSTASDILKFDIAVDKGKILSPEMMRIANTPYKTANGDEIPYAYGRYVQYLKGEKVIWHGGWDPDAGFSALYLKFPERDITIVLLANSEGLWWGNPLDKAEIQRSPIFQAAHEIFSL